MKPLSERQIQIQCVGWFRQKYPEASSVFFSTPNAGKRNVWTGKNMKDEGMSIDSISRYTGLTIEEINKL